MQYAPSCDAEAQLLTALRASPLDDDLRAVYADWLEAQGQTQRAQLLRAETEVVRPGVELVVRFDKLAPPQDHAWRAIVARSPIERCLPLGRGEPCAGRWDALTVDPNNDSVRHCETCARDVQYCHSYAAAKRAGRDRDPIALDAAIDRGNALAAYDGPIRWDPRGLVEDDMMLDD